jgi:hypothetical protein
VTSWHPAAADAEGLSALCGFGDGEGFLALERRNLDVSAERERGEVERNLAVEIVAFTLKERVLLNVHDDVQIAGGTTVGSGLALAAQTQTLTSCDARRDAHRDLALLLQSSRAAACFARLGDDLPGTAALAAGARDREEPLLITKLTASVTLRTGRRFRTWRSARAVAALARFLARDLDRRFRALGGFLERDFEVVAQIGSALRTAAAPAAAEDVSEAEDVAQSSEDVLEAGEDRRVEAARRRRRPGRRGRSGRTYAACRCPPAPHRPRRLP